MKLVYIAHVGLFDHWAHTVQIMKMCEAFSENSTEVTLVVPKRRDGKGLDPFQFNHTKRNFKIAQVPYIDLFQGSPSTFLYFLRFFSFLISSRVYLFFKSYDVVYTREYYFVFFFKKVFIELHALPGNVNTFKKIALNSLSGYVVLTSFIKAKLEELGIDGNKIIVAHDSVRIEDFQNILSISEAKEKLNLNKEEILVGYIGTLKTMGMEKGVSTAIDAMEFLPDNFKLYVVGGESKHLDFYKNYVEGKKLSNRVIFKGTIPHGEIPLNISACSILVAPFPAKEHYMYFMSPLKIFEYMASKRPIIVTDLPSLKEVLKEEETALFIPPETPKALANAILKLNQDSELVEKLIKNAYRTVSEIYTWKIRAKNILSFINC